jgi:hypothetical protein
MAEIRISATAQQRLLILRIRCHDVKSQSTFFLEGSWSAAISGNPFWAVMLTAHKNTLKNSDWISIQTPT